MLEKFSELLGQPLQIGKGGLREGIILDLLDTAPSNGASHALAAVERAPAAFTASPVAKARAIPGLGQDDPYAAAAARVIEVRARELVELAAGVLDTDDIERASRHAGRHPSPARRTRGLRALLSRRSAYKAALREVKALADALGERRDRDVHIDALTEFADGDRTAAPGSSLRPVARA